MEIKVFVFTVEAFQRSTFHENEAKLGNRILMRGSTVIFKNS